MTQTQVSVNHRHMLAVEQAITERRIVGEEPPRQIGFFVWQEQSKQWREQCQAKLVLKSDDGVTQTYAGVV